MIQKNDMPVQFYQQIGDTCIPVSFGYASYPFVQTPINVYDIDLINIYLNLIKQGFNNPVNSGYDLIYHASQHASCIPFGNSRGLVKSGPIDFVTNYNHITKHLKLNAPSTAIVDVSLKSWGNGYENQHHSLCVYYCNLLNKYCLIDSGGTGSNYYGYTNCDSDLDYLVRNFTGQSSISPVDPGHTLLFG